MTAQASEEKITALVTALEKFNLVVFAALQAPHLLERQMVVNDARTVLSDALRNFLVPALRLIDGNKGVDVFAEKVTCLVCNRTEKCADVGCPNWAAAIRAKINKSVKSKGPTDGPRAA